MTKKLNISIFGAGSLGQALAYLAATNKHQIKIYDTNPSQIRKITRNPKFKSFKNISFLEKKNQELYDADLIIPCIPSQAIKKFYQELSSQQYSRKILSITKGFYPKSHSTISQSTKGIISPKNFIVSSGPNFADEIINHAPTQTVVASSNATNFSLIKKVLETNFFHIQTTKKIIPTEISGILKNCYSITLGMVDHATHSMNARATTICRILDEINPLFTKIKAGEFTHSITFLGDLIATGFNPHSRNYRCGYLLKKDKKTTTEGIDNIKPAIAFAKQHKVDLKILKQTEKIINHQHKPAKIMKLI